MNFRSLRFITLITVSFVVLLVVANILVAANDEVRYMVLKPISSLAYVVMGNQIFKSGDIPLAQTLFGQAIKDDDNSIAHHNLGVSYYEQGLLEEAEDEFRSAIDTDPEYAKAYNSLAILLFEQEQYDQAAEYFRNVVQLEEQNLQAHFDLGVSIANNVRYNSANVSNLYEALDQFLAAGNYPNAGKNADVMRGILDQYEKLSST